MKLRFADSGTVKYGVSLPEGQLPKVAFKDLGNFVPVGQRCPGIVVAYFESKEAAEITYQYLVDHGVQPSKDWK